ncbi:MAG: ATP-binding cassette domain-containing protein, partial [Burkholderiales bacterium]
MSLNLRESSGGLRAHGRFVADSPSLPQLAIRELRHAYGSNEVIRGLSFSLTKGTIGCLLGASGCGKTTVLRCIAGFEPVSAGEIWLNGQLVSRRGVLVPTEARRVGMVFQDYALFPHLTV